jgi:signal transduction histidine kinase
VKIKGNIGTSNQLRWVVLLLAIAVILPTVCLLWFMSEAVRNERLAVKQKLSAVYRKRLETLSDRIDGLWSARIDIIEKEAAARHEPVRIFDRIVGRDARPYAPNICDAVVIYDENGRLLYPVTAGQDHPGEFPPEFNPAWNAEFIEEDYNRAIEMYEQFIAPNDGDYISYSAVLGKIRCLRKSGQIEKAITLCRQMAYGQAPDEISVSSVALIARARILLIKLKEEGEAGLQRSDLEDLIVSSVNYAPGSGNGFLLMPSGTRIFLLRKAIEMVQQSRWTDELKPQIARAKELLSAEELSAAVLEKYYTGAASEAYSEKDANDLVSLLSATLQTIEGLELTGLTEQVSEEVKRQISTVLDAHQARKMSGASFGRLEFAAGESWPADSIRRLELPRDAFGLYHNAAGRTYLLLKTVEQFNADFDSYGADLEELGIAYRITDGFGSYACGLQNPEKTAFLTAPLGKFFPNWSIGIHFKDIDIFETAAEKQRVVYLWTGVLAIAVMISAGLLATKVVGKQIRINKLKNDFIATVSHELKTPLASMRVLVDTLLEGSYRDQQQVTEYLQLVSKENERLTGLIDNFLTFSRMERNKQAFDMTRTSPAAIARDAAEAVKTKFGKGRCAFDVDIPQDLPDVSADRDAMVTVLVNLLDNAYKYSYDKKEIELRVSPENSCVCFCVSDNGRGMSRRAARKVFNRFYQADSSLSRQTEGCGLGLSIAKFIVDAHKGTISVESKVGKGSVFTVKLPACN